MAGHLVGELGPRTSPRTAELLVGDPGDRQPDRFRAAGVPEVQRERRCGPTVVRIGRQSALDDGDQLGRGAGGQLPEVGQVAGRRDGERVGRGGGVPGRDAGERMERGRGHAEDVGRRARGAAPRNGGVDVGRGDLGGRHLPQHAGHPEVGEHRAPLGREDDVPRGEVAVHHPVSVRVGQRGGDRRDRRDHLPRPQPTAAGEQCGEAAALEQVEDERDPGGATAARLVHDLDQPDQVRMVQLAEQRRFPRLPLRVAVDEHLDRDGRPTASGDGAPHLARTTAAEQRLEDVPGDDGRVGACWIGCGHDRGR